MPDRRRLICPGIRESFLADHVSSMDRYLLRAVASRYRDPHETFGLELKVTFLLDTVKVDEALERIRRVYYRLSQEPIIYSHWPQLKRIPLDRAQMLTVASILNGAPVSYRRGEIGSYQADNGRNLLYEPLRKSERWIADIARVDASDADPVKKALYRFARIINAHPFTNANGRFARAALQASLSQSNLLHTPCLALAPTFYSRAARIRTIMQDLNATGDWNVYFNDMGEVLSQALGNVVEVTSPPSSALRFEG